jgi:helix-turn-helix protein
MDDRLLTPDEASARLRIAKQTSANWRSQGTGPEFLKQGGRIFYSQSRLVAWQEDRTFGCTGDYRKARTRELIPITIQSILPSASGAPQRLTLSSRRRQDG